MNTVTAKQVEFINRLQAERRWEDTPAMATMVEDARFAWRKGEFSKRDASLLIHDLGFMPRRETAAVEAPAESLEGMHTLDGQVYKVQVAVHGSGRPYAKRLVLDMDNISDVNQGAEPVYSARFEYAAGVIKRLSADTKMSLEAAKEFGVLYGTCCVCSRTLTNEASIAAGIGPVCAGKF